MCVHEVTMAVAPGYKYMFMFARHLHPSLRVTLCLTMQNREDMTNLAGRIVDNCQRMAEFANLVAQQCTDQM